MPQAQRSHLNRLHGLGKVECPPDLPRGPSSEARHARAKARSASSRRCPADPRSGCSTAKNGDECPIRGRVLQTHHAENHTPDAIAVMMAVTMPLRGLVIVGG